MSEPATSGASARPRATRWIWVAALAGTITWASGHTVVAAPSGILGFDKLAHFCVFGLLATLVLRSPGVWARERRRGWIAIAATAVFGLTDEWHQSFTPGRSVEWTDWIADTGGAVFAVVVYLRWAYYRRILEILLWPLRRTPRSVAGTPQA